MINLKAKEIKCPNKVVKNFDHMMMALEASLGCPSNQVAYKNSGSATPRTCTAAAQDCPIGYFCQFSSINSQFQCCGISGGCPNDQVNPCDKNINFNYFCVLFRPQLV